MSEFLMILGLILNLIGSLFVAYSVKKNPGGAHQMLENGERIYLAVIDYKRFRVGISLLIVGFISQLVGPFWDYWVGLLPSVLGGVVLGDMNIGNIPLTYWGLAVLSSFFMTYFAPQIHGLEPKEWGDFPWPLRISQWILNFLGSFVGWLGLAYLIFWRLQTGTVVEFTDLVVLLVAFYGITGYLPYILIQKGFPFKG